MRRRVRRSLYRAVAPFVAVLLLALTLVSCAGSRQINELAIVTAVGISEGEEPGSVRLAAQIIRPADARGQTGAPSGGTGQPIYSVSTEGDSIFAAIRKLGRFSSRRVYWAHNFVIVMNEQYARNGIDDMIDFFTRNHELRMETWVAVTSDSPDELISTITGLEIVPGEALNRLFHDNQIAGEAPATNMMNLEEAFLSKSTEPMLARLSLAPRGISNKKPGEHGSLKQVELSGAGVFKNGKMVGWLTSEETRGAMFFIEKLHDGIEVVSCPNGQGKLSLEFKGANMKVAPTYRSGNPAFAVKLSTRAEIVENGCRITADKIRKDAEQELEQKLTQAIESVVRKAQQQYRSDFLKLGDVFRNKFPEEWRTIGRNWNEHFAEAKIAVKVKVDINSAVVKAIKSGITTK